MKPILIKLLPVDPGGASPYQSFPIAPFIFCVAGAAFDDSLLGLAVVFVRLGPRMESVVRCYVLLRSVRSVRSVWQARCWVTRRYCISCG